MGDVVMEHLGQGHAAATLATLEMIVLENAPAEQELSHVVVMVYALLPAFVYVAVIGLLQIVPPANLVLMVQLANANAFSEGLRSPLVDVIRTRQGSTVKFCVPGYTLLTVLMRIADHGIVQKNADHQIPALGTKTNKVVLVLTHVFGLFVLVTVSAGKVRQTMEAVSVIRITTPRIARHGVQKIIADKSCKSALPNAHLQGFANVRMMILDTIITPKLGVQSACSVGLAPPALCHALAMTMAVATKLPEIANASEAMFLATGTEKPVKRVIAGLWVSFVHN